MAHKLHIALISVILFLTALVNGNIIQLQPTTCQIDYGTDYPGCDVGSSKEGSWQECAKRCGDDPKCNYWSWQHKLSVNTPFMCYRKSGKCMAKEGSECVSGNKACATEYYCTPYYGRDWVCQNDLRRIDGVEDWKICAQLCYRNTECQYWAWQHPGSSDMPKSCFLKKSGACRLVRRSNAISGRKDCQTFLK